MAARAASNRAQAFITRHPRLRAQVAFHSLGARLAVQFGALFTLAMAIVALSLSVLVARSLSHQVAGELAESGAVFDRLWQQRADELGAAGALAARDFGFRAAVATADEATMRSALDNIRARARVESAFIVGVDGRVHGLANPAMRSEAAALHDGLDDGRTEGVAVIGGRVRQVIAAPILSPQLTGWLVLASDIDARRLGALERLSAIPLRAEVLVAGPGSWLAATDAGIGRAPRPDQPVGRLFEVDGPRGSALALERPLPTLRQGREAVLLLTYPKALAYAQQRRLLAALALLSALGLVGVLVVTWSAARRITQPLARLDKAAARIAEGESERVAIHGADELSRLARTFNRMAGEIEERERRITHLAFNDGLTGLPNRALFHEHLALTLRNAAAGEKVAVHFLDLDHFKSTNDTLGHPAGDRLLVEVAERLAQAARDHFVARLSGDEFVVIQRPGADPDAVDRLARAVLDVVAQPFVLDGHQLRPSTSIGIALYPHDGQDPATLVKSADLALYRAKETGRGNLAYFEEALNEAAQHRRHTEADLHAAIREGEFELLYQPLQDLRTGAISSFEALIRWHHPTRGLVSPAEFIAIAEDSGLIVPIGAWALQSACRAATRWPAGIRVAVNVSAIQFHRGGLVEHVLLALGHSGLAPQRLELELTESVFLKGDDATLAMLHQLRGLGVRIALDDFGTGYSSLSYLQSFPFDKIKIDQSFIRNLLTRPGATAVVRAIIDLATALGMETTAEGVEDPAQRDALRAEGCSTIQGYLLSRPVDAAAVESFFAETSRERIHAA